MSCVFIARPGNNNWLLFITLFGARCSERTNVAVNCTTVARIALFPLLFPPFFSPPLPPFFFLSFFFLFVSIPLEPSRTRRFVKYRATTLLPLRGRCRRGREKKRRVINYRRIYATRDDEESVEPFGKHYQTCYRFVPCPLLYSSACKLEMIDDVEHPSYLRFIFTDHRVVPSLPMHSHRR